MRPAEEKIILNTSDESAKRVTVTGWVSRDGRFYGDDERIARWAGATHIICSCGRITPKSYTACDACREQSRNVRYAALPRAQWDGVAMLCVFEGDLYFNSIEEAQEHAETNETTLEALQLVICAPKRYREIDPNDYYCDDLPEDGEVDGEIEDAFNELNKRIRSHTSPISWWPSKVALALNVEDELKAEEGE